MRKPVSQKRRKGPDQGRRSAESKQRHTAHVGRGIDEEKMRRDTPHFGSGLSEKPLHAHEPASRLVPYDETLLERARVQWQFGDWDSLAALDRVTLQHHPERGRLALLAAAGYLQKGNMEAAGEVIRLAQDWGCSNTLIAQILIGGLHNTLGRAAAIAGQQSRALKHFESAIAIGAPGSEVRLIAQARAGQQLAELGLSDKSTIPQLTEDTLASITTSTFSQRASASIEALQRQNKELVVQVEKQSEDLNKLRSNLEKSLKREIWNSTKQLEAFIEVRNYLSTGEVIGDMHGWPISPDFALYLVKLVEANDYDVVIEFGSGTSTVLIARALAKVASRHQARMPVVQIAFEHLPEYRAQTLAQLQRVGLADSVQLMHAPLEPYVAPDGNTYSYYSCQATLAELARRHHSTARRVLVVVDGPPQSTGKHARYPAVPVVLASFAGPQIDILLDDHDRDDESQVAEAWVRELERKQFSIESTSMPFEKGAFLLTVKARHN